MRIDDSAAEQFLAYADGEQSLGAVWGHPAYDVVRTHAELLGRDLTQEDVARAMAGEATTFGLVDDLAEHRAQIETLLTHVSDHETAWAEEIERQLARITPEAELAEFPVYLAVGYSFGIGTRDGAVLNVNEPLFFDHPRQVLYAAIHECSHVVYDRVHEYSRELGPDLLETRAGQRQFFETLFHTEAFATYAPLARRRAEGALGTVDHRFFSDYRVLDDDGRLGELVGEYDAFRATLDEGAVSRERLLKTVFGESRLPYRVGCAMLDRIEQVEGVDAVREAFYLEPREFFEDYEWALDAYRSAT